MRGHSKLIRVPSLLYTEFMSALFGDANLHFLSVVLYDFLLAVGGDNGELALLEHAGVLAFALADGQLLLAVVPPLRSPMVRVRALSFHWKVIVAYCPFS